MNHATSSRVIKSSVVRRGITLIELLLSLGLIVLVSSMMFLFYNQTLRTREHGRRTMIDGHLARVVATKIAEEIRSANGFLFGLGPGIDGNERQITIQTEVVPERDVFRKVQIQDAPVQGQCDVRQIQYYLAYDPDESYDYSDGTQGPAPLGLVRAEIKTLYQSQVNEDDDRSMTLDLYSGEIKYLRFRYFDGAEWLDRWKIGASPLGRMANTLPQAVEVTVGYDELLPPEEEEEGLNFDDSNLTPALPEYYSPRTYTVTVWLPQADVFMGARLLRAQQSLSSSGTDGAGGGL